MPLFSTLITLNARFVIFILSLLAMSNCAYGQNPLKLIKTALKSNKPAEALALVEKHRKDSSSIDMVQLLTYGFEAGLKLNDIENEKIYLRQRPDTTAFFTTLYSVFHYALQADSVAFAQEYSNSGYKRVRKNFAARLNQLYPNLDAATRFLMQKERWKEVAEFSRMAIEARHSPIFAEHGANITPAMLSQYAERHMFSNFSLKRYEEVGRYMDIALEDSLQREIIFETAVQANKELNRESDYLRYLHKGLSEFPRNMFFFTRIAEEHLAHRQANKLLSLIDTLLANDPQNAKLYEYQAKSHLQQGNDSLCIVAARNMQQYDTLQTYADYYIGQGFFNLARKIELPQSINAVGYREAYGRQQHFYGKARPYMEFYRKNHPDDQNTWAPILYEIYLKLNLGKEFEDIMKYIQK